MDRDVRVCARVALGLCATAVLGVPVPAAAADRPTMYVLGDSFAGGSLMGGSGEHGWPAITAGRMGLRLALDGEGGSGYTTAGLPGTRPYPERTGRAAAAEPSLVIVEGSVNDRTSGPDVATPLLEQAAERTLGDLRSELPQARFLVIGPIYSAPERRSRTANDDVVHAAADMFHMQYVSPVQQGWFTGTSNQFIGADRVHPTDAGHAYLAEKIVAALASGDPASPPGPGTTSGGADAGEPPATDAAAPRPAGQP